MSDKSMSHPEHEDPAMAGHDDERAERRTRPARMPTPLTKQEREVLERAEARLHERAVKALFESALSALLDASDNAKAAAQDIEEADEGFELVRELRVALINIDMVKSRVAERLGYLESLRGIIEDAPSATDPDASGNGGDRRLETHPDASGDHNDFPHPFAPAESPAAGGRTRVPAGEGSGLYLGSPRDSLVPPPAAPQAERARARGVALEALSAPTMGPEELRLLWAEGDR